VVSSAGSARPAVAIVTVALRSLSQREVSRAIAMDPRRMATAGSEVPSWYWLERLAATVSGARILNAGCDLAAKRRHHRLATGVIAAVSPVRHGHYAQL
jgi:hypothetical protein